MIVFGGGSPKSMLVYGLVSIAILAFSYFVIIKPITDSTNDTVDRALNETNHALNQSFGGNANNGSGSSSSSSSSGGDATADDVYNACIDAVGNAGKAGCASARDAFNNCADTAKAQGGLAESSALDACQQAANQAVNALKAAG
jgi:hypothetical protein